MEQQHSVDSKLKDLETKGFVVLPSFLSEEDCEFFAADFNSQEIDKHNVNYAIKFVSNGKIDRIKEKLDKMTSSVRANTDIRVDLVMGGLYFSISHGTNFPWHQDHESYFIIQNHHDYLNFYIPIIKPEREKSNLSVIPFDLLRVKSPYICERLVGNGASNLRKRGDKIEVVFAGVDELDVFGCDPDSIAITPKLNRGDLLLMRGDIIHKTQDNDTARVALSVRVTHSQQIVSRATLAKGGLLKYRMMMMNRETYRRIFRYFDVSKRDEVTVCELMQYLGKNSTATRPLSAVEFLAYVLAQKLRARVFVPFARAACVRSLQKLRRAAARMRPY